MSKFAYVTLLLNSDYLPGTLTLAKSIIDSNSKIPIILLLSKSNISNEVYKIILNSNFFNRLINIDSYLIETNNKFELNNLLKRSDLKFTLTKLNIWKLIDYDLLIYLDSDILLIENIDNLFEIFKNINKNQILASSDSGWPDIFNSGFFIIKPSFEIFDKLLSFLNENISFDGADQGILNEFFNLQSFKTGCNWYRLPFTYNCTLNSNYEYLPALLRFKNSIKLFHFIGLNKPWKNYNLCYDQKFIKIFNNNNDNLFKLWWNKFDSINIKDFSNLQILNYSNNTLNSEFINNDKNVENDNNNNIESKDKQIELEEMIEHQITEQIDDKTEIDKSDKIQNPFLSPIQQTDQHQNLYFPTFYYKKPSNSNTIVDESNKGEAWKMDEGKIKWPDENSNDNNNNNNSNNNEYHKEVNYEQKHQPIQEYNQDIKNNEISSSEPVENLVDKYVDEHPIFPWEKNKVQPYAISRTFQNSSEFKPPMYSISIMNDLDESDNSDDDESNNNDDDDDDDKNDENFNLVGFKDGDKFEKYLNKIERIHEKISILSETSSVTSNENTEEKLNEKLDGNTDEISDEKLSETLNETTVSNDKVNKCTNENTNENTNETLNLNIKRLINANTEISKLSNEVEEGLKLQDKLDDELENDENVYLKCDNLELDDNALDESFQDDKIEESIDDLDDLNG